MFLYNTVIVFIKNTYLIVLPKTENFPTNLITNFTPNTSFDKDINLKLQTCKLFSLGNL